jgi:SAM-dependent methyltransferase
VTDPIDGNRDAVRRGGEIYDNPEFLDNYLKLRQKRAGLNEAIEIPALTRLLPEVHGIDILELGCGNGKLARSLAAIGARHVLAVDGSRSMLATATRAPRVTYVHASIEDIRLRPTTVDLIVSSLALHYVADFDSVIARAGQWLRPGGYLVFSTEHPVCTAPLGDTSPTADGAWRLHGYAREGPRVSRWFIDGVEKHHRTTSTIVSTLLRHGFAVTGLLEPAPTIAQVEQRPDLQIHRERPSVLVVAARTAPCDRRRDTREPSADNFALGRASNHYHGRAVARTRPAGATQSG